MILIIFYSVLLLGGILISQLSDLSNIHGPLSTLTVLCLAYIMVEVGLEFELNKKNLTPYAKDFAIATTAATFPWIFCAVYFIAVFGTGWQEAASVGLAAAPTSAGVLFAMLSAAGLGATWLFQKARVLAVADDLVTILLMIPLKVIVVGWKAEIFYVLSIIAALLIAAYTFLNRFVLPVGKFWLFSYSMLLVIILAIVERTTHVHLEILFPAFAFGCMLFNPHRAIETVPTHEQTHLEPPAGRELWFDRCVKGTFMFLVGCSLPKVDIGETGFQALIFHIIVLTVLSNLGKCFPMLCYRKEASLHSRVALGIAMFPRGEVGAGVLLIALSYGFGGIAVSLAVLSLALNLLLTGVFILIVFKLLEKDK